MMRWTKQVGWGLAGFALALACGRVGAAYQKTFPVPAPQPGYSGQQSSSSQTRVPFDDAGIQIMEDKREKSMNNERQRMIVKDANLLVQTAAELEARVSSDPLGAGREDEAKRAETIEKLARNVKDRMKGMR